MQPAYKQVNDPKWLENLLRRLNEVVGTASTVEIEKKTGVHREVGSPPRPARPARASSSRPSATPCKISPIVAPPRPRQEVIRSLKD